MVLLAALPASVDITNLNSEELFVADARLPVGGPTTVTLTGREDGNKSDVWKALYSAQEAGLLSSSPTLDALEDPVASGHTLFGGQDPIGAVTPE